MEVEAEVSPLLRELWAAAVDGARGHIQMDSTTLPALGSGPRSLAAVAARPVAPFRTPASAQRPAATRYPSGTRSAAFPGAVRP